MVRCASVLLALLVFLARPIRADADSSTSGPPGYADAIAKGIDEFGIGNLPEAREEFRRAHGLFPNARTLRGLGMVEFELRNYSQAVRLLEQALASQVRPLEGKMRSDVEGVVERARRYLGKVELQLEPATAAVLVDGTRADLQPDGTLLLEVGDHKLEVQATGWAPERRELNVQGGERSILRVALSPLRSDEHVAEVASLPMSPERADREPAYRKWWVWTTVGAIASAGVITTVLLMRRDGEQEVRAVRGTNTTGVTLQTLAAF